ncbi:hypothetical protein QN372_15590 [Undibacterium sp. RTI2.1]|uniref:hypothetical protein n=1 Tax=unclassified Undibacterium TaxID=2630295 RepID=UPI002B2259CC|nr:MULTISPECIES: hypothetical protein [unclassified Undibacterium]MEB0032180.1 hypothetical protein [Undibacterium sp. RTI2.1]MEB0118254.1 hypothetical protein [Undibacterium sp. RTI2.2]
MATIIKRKPPRGYGQSSSELFGKLSEMFSKVDRDSSNDNIAVVINKFVRELRKQGRDADVSKMRDILWQMARNIDRLVPVEDNAALSELARAQSEDVLFKNVMDAAKGRGHMAISTPESIRQGNKAIALAEQNTAGNTLALIASQEFISSGQLQSALHVQRQAISGAVKAKRLFAIIGPSGANYYPAYFADPTLDRRSLERVSKVLRSLPAHSKHHFFTSKSTLLRETPLEALRKGRDTEVLLAAAGFAER